MLNCKTGHRRNTSTHKDKSVPRTSLSLRISSSAVHTKIHFPAACDCMRAYGNAPTPLLLQACSESWLLPHSSSFAHSTSKGGPSPSAETEEGGEGRGGERRGEEGEEGRGGERRGEEGRGGRRGEGRGEEGRRGQGKGQGGGELKQ